VHSEKINAFLGQVAQTAPYPFGHHGEDVPIGRQASHQQGALNASQNLGRYIARSVITDRELTQFYFIANHLFKPGNLRPYRDRADLAPRAILAGSQARQKPLNYRTQSLLRGRRRTSPAHFMTAAGVGADLICRQSVLPPGHFGRDQNITGADNAIALTA